MAQELELYSKCPQCNGTGEHQSSHGQGGSSIPCNWPGCNATGYLLYGKMTIDPGLDTIDGKCDTLIAGGSNVLSKCNTIDSKCDTLINGGSNVNNKCNTIIDKCDEILTILGS